MSHDLFNMRVHILATTEHQNLKSSNQRITKYYMDLRFCVRNLFYLQSLKCIWYLTITFSLCQAISNFGCDQKFRKKVEAKELSKTLRSCSSQYYDISHCRYVRLFNLIILYHIFNNILMPANVQILLPYSVSMTYTLFVLDHTERTLMMFDTSAIEKCFQDISNKRFIKKF
jgi:hypothetical protein